MQNSKALTTKEQIASRMIRNAAQQWGYSDTDIDNFDPIVSLLLEACAVEVNLINHEIIHVQDRMLKKLAAILNPDVYSASKPAHAIMFAYPIEPEVNLQKQTQFYTKVRNTFLGTSRNEKNEETHSEIYFSPASELSVSMTQVAVIATNNSLFSVNETHTKELIKNSKNLLAPNEVLIGIEVNKKLESLKELRLFIDIRNNANASDLVKQLEHINIDSDFGSVDFEIGYGKSINKEVESQEAQNTEFLSFQNLSYRLENETLDYYKHHFLTISEHEILNKLQDKITLLPGEELLEHDAIEEFQGLVKSKCLWLKLSFLPSFSTAILNHIVIGTNCFPVLNRKINHVRYRLQRDINIVPLFAEDSFLDIVSVENSDGKEYSGDPLRIKTKEERGVYSIRNSGVERFDNRSSKEMLEYLTNLLKDESGAFAAYGQDFISSTIKDLNANIALIEKRLLQSNKKLRELTSYLFVKPFEEGDNIFVQFWTTNGEQGNSIRSGQKFDLGEGSDISSKKEIVLLTSSVGGRDKLEGPDLLHSYRNALITRDRIVSTHDIENLTKQLFRGRLQSVSVSKGVEVSKSPLEGLLRTIDVNIKLKKVKSETPEIAELIENLKHELFTRLKKNSVYDSRYRVFIQN